MGLFSAIAKGSRARKRGVACTTLDGVAFTCDLGVIDAGQESEVLAAATKRATATGAEAKPGGVVFDFEYAVQLVAISALDPDSQDDKPAMFFDGGADQIRGALDRERVLMLAEVQRVHQEATSPLVRKMGQEEFFSLVVRLASEEEGAADPFWTLPRSMRESFTRSMAGLLVISHMGSSASGGGDTAEALPS